MVSPRVFLIKIIILIFFYTRVGSEHSIVPSGVVGGTSLAPTPRAGLKKSGRAFMSSEVSTWVGLGSSVG